MRLGVLDVGSNTIHLLVVNARPGAMPVPEASKKSTMRLMKYLEPDGSISEDGVERIMSKLHTAAALIEDLNLDELMPMATSALREAKNGQALLDRIRNETGIDLHVMSGEDEASVTFLAVRRWFGWSAGRITLVDIGGGSLELATGTNELPELAMSVPLGAGRMTRRFFESNPPTSSEIKKLRQHIRRVLPDAVREFGGLPNADQFVGSSKTVRSWARLAGSVTDGVGPTDRVRLRKHQLDDWVPRLAAMPAASRSALPGVTKDRSYQIVAGGIVLAEVMDAFGIEELDVSPWAMREGVLLDYLDRLPRDPR
ncbi:Ppx/GppA phosphatase family protein [Gulosibacter chungangensis]|uniref:Ppx/GppA family phosphatase n=1 Tax=Gulosibacter chungangensis TaxID=979746 RepID=A0A7J5B8W9_9MICO|nr:Ppx/GppA phosphatase family protein [Gulosibacter chungangensis]KAB1640810.1 Ppx/GppA family phosphatase [Gulosibacter chungangensis]